MTTFLDRIDLLKYTWAGDNAPLMSKINFAAFVGSTAIMAYLYRMSISKQKLGLFVLIFSYQVINFT